MKNLQNIWKGKNKDCRNFRERDIYNLSGRNKEYIFDKLENWGYDEKHFVENYEIEHIMPQNPNLSQEWIDAYRKPIFTPLET